MQHPVSDSSAPPPAARGAHLEAERLAALADEAPTPAELAHLAACDHCRREREAYTALLALTRAEGSGNTAADVYGSADPAPAAGGDADAADAAWAALAATLRAEGLATTPAAADGGQGSANRRRWAFRPGRQSARAAGAARWASRGVPRWPARLAAGLVLAVGAASLGRLSAVRGPLAVGRAVAPDAPPTFASSDEARAELARARRDYAYAAAYLAAADPAAIPGADPVTGEALAAARGAAGRREPDAAALLRARLATLDALLPRVRAAARQAPEDPAVNQLYLAAYDAREAALRELGQALPAGVQLTGY
jgi:hypothetical protein